MGKRGPKPWEPTEAELRQIRLYAGLGSTQDQVATLVGKHVNTIKGNETAKAAFEEGKAETVAKVAGSLVAKALKGDTASAIFYLKTQAGWRETVRNEHTGKDGGPIEYANLSDEEVAARIAAHEADRGKQPTTH